MPGEEMRKHGKVDGNHAEIVAALRRTGAQVVSLAPIGQGCPDLLVGRADGDGRPRNYLLEVKTDTGKLTPDEQEFFSNWPGQVRIVRCVEDALKVICAI
jgi:hypothetical protein